MGYPSKIGQESDTFKVSDSYKDLICPILELYTKNQHDK